MTPLLTEGTATATPFLYLTMPNKDGTGPRAYSQGPRNGARRNKRRTNVKGIGRKKGGGLGNC